MTTETSQILSVKYPQLWELYRQWMPLALNYLHQSALQPIAAVQLSAGALETQAQSQNEETTEAEEVVTQLIYVLPPEKIVTQVDIQEMRNTPDDAKTWPFYIPKYKTIPSFKLFVNYHLQNLLKLEPALYSNLLEQLRAIMQASPNQALSGMGIALLNISLHSPFIVDLEEIAETHQSFEPNPEIIKTRYSHLETFLDLPAVTYKSFSILTNLNLQDITRFELDENYTIGYLDEAGKNFYGREPVLPRLEDADLLNLTFTSPLLESSFPGIPTKMPFSPNVDDLLLAFRLHFPVYSLGYIPGIDYTQEYKGFYSISWTHQREEAYGESKLNLTRPDLEQFRDFWQNFIGLQHILKKELEIAVDRFTASYSHSKWNNQLLDLVIGLESIFSEGPESISYKYALRGAVATAIAGEERIELFDTLKRAYSMRSSLAHGDKLDGKSRKILDDPKEAEKFIQRLRTVLARAILCAATWKKNNSGKSFNRTFLIELDSAMLETTSYPFWR